MKIIFVCCIVLVGLVSSEVVSNSENNFLDNSNTILSDESGQDGNGLQDNGQGKGKNNNVIYTNDAVNPAGKLKGWAKKNGGISASAANGDLSFGMNPNGKFKGWMKKYLRNYGPEEEQIRFDYFHRNIQLIQNHNSGKKSSYEMAANKFADLSDDEFRAYYLMTQAPTLHMAMTIPQPQPQDNIDDQSNDIYTGDSVMQDGTNNRLLQRSTGSSINWRTKIRFAPIKDQGKCAACYAFGAIAAVQLNKALKLSSKQQPILSEQQIVDCCGSSGYRCNGCTSGNIGSTFDFLADKGIATSRSYPYIGVASRCNLNRVSTSSYLQRSRSYYQMSGQSNLLYYLRNYGPVVVAADASTWKFYYSGIFDGCVKRNFTYTHAITIVEVEVIIGYYTIRNSWGADWGEDGNIRLKIQKGVNICGIYNYIYYPLVS